MINTKTSIFTIKKTALVLDVDNTLTPPRQPIEQEMANILNRLRVPFLIAAGSHLPILKKQFFEPLYQSSFRKTFDAFVSNGAIHYHCDYTNEMSIEMVSEFNIKEHLGESGYHFVINKLVATLEREDYQLPNSITLVDEKIVDRGSMINFCPMGRKNQEDADATRNRENFVAFDEETHYRKKLIGHLNLELSTLINTRQLKIAIGGQTSLDVGIIGEDKTKPLRVLLKNGFERIVFIGDALFNNGNDAPIIDFIHAWPKDAHCPVEAIPTASWHETMNIIRQLQFVD